MHFLLHRPITCLHASTTPSPNAQHTHQDEHTSTAHRKTHSGSGTGHSDQKHPQQTASAFRLHDERTRRPLEHRWQHISQRTAPSTTMSTAGSTARERSNSTNLSPISDDEHGHEHARGTDAHARKSASASSKRTHLTAGERAARAASERTRENPEFQS